MRFHSHRRPTDATLTLPAAGRGHRGRVSGVCRYAELHAHRCRVDAASEHLVLPRRVSCLRARHPLDLERATHGLSETPATELPEIARAGWAVGFALSSRADDDFRCT